MALPTRAAICAGKVLNKEKTEGAGIAGCSIGIADLHPADFAHASAGRNVDILTKRTERR